MQMLTEVGIEQKFEVTYVDIDEKTEEGQVQYLVQLSTLPVNFSLRINPIKSIFLKYSQTR
jgi:hypothetical protein